MLGLVSTSTGSEAALALKTVLPIGIGLASAAFLTIKAATRNTSNVDKSIPTASFRAGETSHDAEYEEDADLFMARFFNVYKRNRWSTVISDPLLREVFMTEDFSFGDALDELSGIHAFTGSITKSKRGFDHPAIHEMIRDIVTPNLALFTPRIVERMQAITSRDLGHSQGRKLIENPTTIFQEMIASAMATVFMGHEVASDRKVLDTFIDCTGDLGKVLAPAPTNTWRAQFNRAKYGIANPLQKHIRVLVEAATPVVQERRRQEAEALEKGIEYKRPLDIMQRVLDDFDKYGVVDLEDVCGHLLVMVLVSVHTTSDSSTYLNYYLAAFPECIDILYQEQLEVLDQIYNEREKQRKDKLISGEVVSAKDFEGTDLDPKQDRDFSSHAVKRMVKMDSFVREFMRFRTERANIPHIARKNIVLSSGMTIHKGNMVMMNLHSTHHNPEMQGEDPAEFRPWRFVGKGKTATKVATDFLPFGMGRHACPGRFLAMQEVKTVGALMVSRYSKIEMQDPSKKMKALRSEVGEKVPTGLYFTGRDAKND
ncbi:hypothetical protein BGZ72_009359 [Mortierella alpina]|nr:hypothetical protein BGZ72_009359 [Mortierella alpina]